MISRERIEQIRSTRVAWQDVDRDLLAAIDEREELLAAAHAELYAATSRGAQDVQNWIVQLLRGSRFEVK